MTDFFVFYVESNAICLIIFAILFFHDLASIDRQEKQIKYDHALIGFMLYFLSDSIWAGVMSGIIPKNLPVVLIINFANFVILTLVTYLWLRFAMAVEQVPHRERRLNKFAIVFPFLVSTTALVLTYCFDPSALLDDNLDVKFLFNLLFIIVPFINIGAVLIYTLKRTKVEENPIERRKHIYIGFFPLIVVLGGGLQIVFPYIPIFCFSCTLLMLVFYIKSMDTRISTDPLTTLNNRGQLMRYISQQSNLYPEGRLTFAMMLDINDFKSVNDTYGHAEGDRALTIVADSMKNAVKNHDMPSFLCRYGGDEFLLILHPTKAEELEPLVADIRAQIESECKINETPYILTIGAGYDELVGKQDTIQKCMQRADKKLYLDKEYCKLSSANGGELAR